MAVLIIFAAIGLRRRRAHRRMWPWLLIAIPAAYMVFLFAVVILSAPF